MGDPGRRSHRGRGHAPSASPPPACRRRVLPWRGRGARGAAGARRCSPSTPPAVTSTPALRQTGPGRWRAGSPGHCDDRAWMYKKLDSTLRGNAAAELSAVERELSPVAGGGRPRLPRPRADHGGRAPALGRGGGRRRRAARTVGGRRRRPADGGPRRARERARGPARAAAARRLGRPGGSACPATRVVVGRRRAASGPVLVVSGSRTPLAARQAERLAVDPGGADDDAADARWRPARTSCSTGPRRAHSAARRHARSARSRPGWSSPSAGDTAHALCAALGVEALRAEREAAPGAPLLRCTLADGRELRLVLKSGSFGGRRARSAGADA